MDMNISVERRIFIIRHVQYYDKPMKFRLHSVSLLIIIYYYTETC